MTDKSIKVDKSKNFDEKGHFTKGNQIGRMPQKGFNLSDLNKLVMEYEKSSENKRGSLLKHYIKRLFKSDQLLAKYMDKNIASKTINQLTGTDGEGIKFIIEKTYEESKKGEIDKKRETGEAESGEL